LFLALLNARAAGGRTLLQQAGSYGFHGFLERNAKNEAIYQAS